MDIYYLRQYSSAHSHSFSLDPSRWFQRGVHGPSGTTAHHRYVAREEIKQCTEWRRISLWLQCVCFKYVTQTGSPPFLLHRVAGPLFINTRALIWLLCKKEQVGFFSENKPGHGLEDKSCQCPRATHHVHASQAAPLRPTGPSRRCAGWQHRSRQHWSLPWGLRPSHQTPLSMYFGTCLLQLSSEDIDPFFQAITVSPPPTWPKAFPKNWLK